MKVTEQIDAMEASKAVDPYKYLVATRVLACVAMLPLLTLASGFLRHSDVVGSANTPWSNPSLPKALL